MYEVANIISNSEGQILQMEGLAPGHYTAHVLFSRLDCFTEAVATIGKALRKKSDEFLSGMGKRKRRGRGTETRRRKGNRLPYWIWVTPPAILHPKMSSRRSTVAQLKRQWNPDNEKLYARVMPRTGWIRDVLDAVDRSNKRLAKDGPDTEAGGLARTAQLRGGDDGIPFPQTLCEYLKKAGDLLGDKRSKSKPSHVRMASDPEELILTCLVPRRSLFQVRVETESFIPRDTNPGFRVIRMVTRVLKQLDVNVLHAHLANHESRYLIVDTDVKSAPEWIVHEESYAMVLGKGVFRFRERRLRHPGYARGRSEFVIDASDIDGMDRAIRHCRDELKHFVIRRVTEPGNGGTS